MVCNATPHVTVSTPPHAITSRVTVSANPVGVATDATNSASTKHMARIAARNAGARMEQDATHTTAHAAAHQAGLVTHVTLHVMMVTMAMDVTPHVHNVRWRPVSAIETRENVHVPKAILVLIVMKHARQVDTDFSVSHVTVSMEQRVITSTGRATAVRDISG